MNLYRSFAILLALLPFSQLGAQTDTSKASFNATVFVRGEFKPVIEQSFKLNIAPSIVDTAEPMKHSFSYSITPQRVASTFNPARLGYVKISERKQRLYNNYIRLGMGNYWTPMADLYYHSTGSKTLNYGARLFHQSSWGSIGRGSDSLPSPTHYGKNHFSTTDLSLFGKKIFNENLQLSSDLAYNHDYSMFYGFNDSTLNAEMGFPRDSVEKSSYGMSYGFLGWHANLKSLNTDVNQLGYEADLGLNNLKGRYGMNEFNLNLDGTVHYGFPVLKQHKGIAFLHFNWQGYKSRFNPQYQEADGDTLLYLPLGFVPATADSLHASRNVVTVNPYLDFIFRRFQVHAGATLGWDGFSNPGHAKMSGLFPDVVISTTFMDNALNLSCGAVGGMEANSWNKIRLMNPYVGPVAEERVTMRWDLYGHMRLSFNKKLELNARAEMNVFDDDLSFVPDHSNYKLHNVFKPLYMSYTRAAVGAELTFVNDEMINMELGGHYYMYMKDSKTLEVLLYRPKFDAHLTANVNYKNKVLVHLQGMLLGKMYSDFSDPDVVGSEPATVPLRTGLGLEVEYLHTRALSFFAKFDNITCQRYYYWANYPSQRINMMLGLTYTIPTSKH